jgi:superfamily II DNA or RNA helicase
MLSSKKVITLKTAYKNTKEKGDIYEKYIYYHLLETNTYKNVWLWKNVPEYELLKSGIMDNWNNARLIRKKESLDNNNNDNRLPDFATDLFSVETTINELGNETNNQINKYSIIQCKNYDDSRKLRPEHLGTFYFMMYRYSKFVNGLVFHTNDLCENLINHTQTNDNIKYNKVIIDTKKLKLYNLQLQQNELVISNSGLDTEVDYNITKLVPFQYQKDAYCALKGKHRTVLQMACGTGKTLVSILLSKDYKQNIIISPLKAYCEQNLERFKSQMPKSYSMLIIDSDNDGRNIDTITDFIKKNSKLCIFVTYKSIDIINSLINNKLVKDYFIIIDEFHNISYQDIYLDLEDDLEEDLDDSVEDFEEDSDEEENDSDEEENDSDEDDQDLENPERKNTEVRETSEMYKLLHSDSRIMFMSATPRLFGDDSDYSDDTEIDNNIFGNIDYTFSMSDAIEQNRVCDYRIFVPTLHIAKETGIELIYNETNIKDYDKELIIKSRYIIKGMMEMGSRKCIIYLQSQNECREMTKIIIEQCKHYFAITHNCNYIISSDLREERKLKLKQFTDFDGYSFMCSVDILNECIDIPKCDSIFIAYPSKSKIKNIQRLCRANRKDKENPNKIANIFLWCDDYKDDLVDFISHIKEYDSKFTFNKITRLNVVNESKTLMMPEIESGESRELENIVVGFKGINNIDIWMKKCEELKLFIDTYNKRPSKNGNDKEQVLYRWIDKQKHNYDNKKVIMKNEKVYKLWTNFINDEKYKKYCQLPTMLENFNINLNKVKEYIDINKKRPPRHSKDRNTNFISQWSLHQINSYKNKIHNMKDETIYKLWTNFINDDKYKIYFQSQYDIFISVLNKLKIYIDTNKKRPSSDSKDKNIKSLGKWIWTKQSNYNKKTENMKDENIYKEWTNFINDDKYKEYMLSPYDSFIINFNKLKIYIDINNKRPSEDSKDNEIRILGKWTNHQGTNYKKKQQNMKNENIFKIWSDFINDTKYNKYFQSMEGLFNIKLNELKLYMDINKNKPSSHSKDANIKIIGSWISTQKKNYVNKISNMKNENIRKKWEEFINDEKYKKYF